MCMHDADQPNVESLTMLDGWRPVHRPLQVEVESSRFAPTEFTSQSLLQCKVGAVEDVEELSAKWLIDYLQPSSAHETVRGLQHRYKSITILLLYFFA